MGTFLRFRGGRYLIVSIHFQDAKQQVTYGNGIFIPVTKVQNEKNKTKQKKRKKKKHLWVIDIGNMIRGKVLNLSGKHGMSGQMQPVTEETLDQKTSCSYLTIITDTEKDTNSTLCVWTENQHFTLHLPPPTSQYVLGPVLEGLAPAPFIQHRPLPPSKAV